MPFRNANSNEMLFKKQKLTPPTPTPTPTTDYYDYQSFHPTDTNLSGGNTAAVLMASDALLPSAIANNDTRISLFDYNLVFSCTPELDNGYTTRQQDVQQQQQEDVPLPSGWTLAGRKRSIFELDTNIHTLSELYSTLVDLRNQLPEPVADQVELLYKKKPSLLPTRSSTDDYYMSMVLSSSSPPPGMDDTTTTTTECQSPHTSSNSSGSFERLYWTYPDFIFELLVHVYLDCICFSRMQPNKLLEQHRLHTLDRAYVCAIYAYAALHALLCHPERFGIYPFMQPLAQEAYQMAFEWVEFDAVDPVTCETLVIMYQYLLTVGHNGEARNLFCLAQRQMELLLTTTQKQQHQHQQDVHRLYAWMAELDWSFALTKFTAPLIEYSQLKKSLDHIQPTTTTEEDQLYVKATKFRIRGLRILLSSQQQYEQGSSGMPSPPHHRLNQWRTKYLETFLYKRHAHDHDEDHYHHPYSSYTLEDKLALRLHALYFAGMLELHQQHMLKGFEADQRWESSKEHWPDYFSSFGSCSSSSPSFEMSTEQTQVEKGLYRSMNAAYGFIQVIRLLLDEKDRCILPQVIDTLSAACTVLYFGNKVVFSNKEMIHKSQEALSFVVHAFLTSTTFAMMECPHIDRFVKKWASLIS